MDYSSKQAVGDDLVEIGATSGQWFYMVIETSLLTDSPIPYRVTEETTP